MKSYRLLTKIGAGILIVLVVIVGLQTYAQRGIQGRIRGASAHLKSATDDIGDQFASGALQYEPYYMDAKYVSSRSYASRAGGIAAPAVATPAIPRKLIRRAEMNLKVKDAPATLQKIVTLVNSFNGILIDSYVNQSSEEDKSGQATFKVPPKDFDAALAGLRNLGKVEYEKLTGEDVTEQYVDMQARLQNAQRVRDRLLKILDERAREVKDILEVERELSRVGAEIESMEGRLKYLDRQVDLATITVSFREKRIAILAGLNFGDEFRRTIKDSLQVFVHTFNGAIVVIAGLIPIAFWILILTAIVLGIKKLFAKR